MSRGPHPISAQPLKLFSFQGESSDPYLSGYTWVAFCDWKMLNRDHGSGPVRFDPCNVKDGDTIFVDYMCLEEFARRILPAIHAKVILVTANYGLGADNPMPGRFAFMLQEPNIAAWFVQNIDRAPSDKLIPIPIGIANKCWEHGNTDLFTQFASRSSQKSIFCYMNYTLLANRVACTNHFRQMGIERIKQVPFTEYLENLLKSVFVVSPPGNGIDCHRTWEALLMGCYPIVLSSSLNSLYEDLPVVIVNDWHEVTLSFLEDKLREFKRRTWSREKLYAPFWCQKVEKFRNSVVLNK